MTNEERFLVSCGKVGETGVRQMLNAGRYEGRKAGWAADWLDGVDNGKSEATRVEERSLVARKPAGPHRHALLIALAVVLAALMGVLLLF